MIEAEHAQTDRVRGAPPPDDYWEPYAQQFKADPRRSSDDPLLDRLLRDIAPHYRVIDVGAGAGRLALPLALHCRHITAVEPSPSMALTLLEQVAEHRIPNVTVVQDLWEEAEVDVGDIALCVHVIYTVRDIGQFIRKLEAHARQRVVIVLFKDPPQSQNYRLWKEVHGEERLPLPGLPQFQEVLKELGVDARTEMLPPQPPRGFDGHQQALEELSRRLYLAPESPKRRVLQEMLSRLLEEWGDTLRIRGAKPLEPGLVWWPPAG